MQRQQSDRIWQIIWCVFAFVFVFGFCICICICNHATGGGGKWQRISLNGGVVSSGMGLTMHEPTNQPTKPAKLLFCKKNYACRGKPNQPTNQTLLSKTPLLQEKLTGVTPPNRKASGLVRKGVGQWIIFRAVATPVPTVHPIPPQLEGVPVWLESLPNASGLGNLTK